MEPMKPNPSPVIIKMDATYRTRKGERVIITGETREKGIWKGVRLTRSKTSPRSIRKTGWWYNTGQVFGTVGENNNDIIGLDK